MLAEVLTWSTLSDGKPERHSDGDASVDFHDERWKGKSQVCSRKDEMNVTETKESVEQTQIQLGGLLFLLMLGKVPYM